jgi:TonB-linked SusC/RagA family outer membrane protein
MLVFLSFTKTISIMKILTSVMLCSLLLICCDVFSQTKQITGKITDATGTPIQGATIKVKGAKGGTSAGADGSFKLTIPENSSLLVSGIGFVSKEVKPGSLTDLTIQLADGNRSLSEVVVTGVSVATSKRKLGINVESISADKLPAAPTASIDQALVGKISGAQISSISGNPGDPVNIVLRGINSVQGGTKPIILVDGVEVRATDINSLDLSNVERIEVVKGAASSTLYGAQGANGVIQIITKKGKIGATAINFSSSYSDNSYINSGNVHKANKHSFLTNAQGEIVDGSGNVITVDPDGSISGLINYVYGGPARAGIWDPGNQDNKPYIGALQYHDHFKEVFQNGSTLNNMLGVSGGSEKSDYNISISDNRTVSPVLHNGYVDRANLTANVGTELFKGFKIRSITQLIYTRNTLVPGLGGAGGFNGSGVPGYGYGNQPGNVAGIFGFLNTSPFFDLNAKLADGTYPILQQASGFLSINSNNPYYVKEYWTGLDNKVDVIQNFDANYRVNKFFELDAKYGINFRNENARWTAANQSNNLNSNDYQDWVEYENGNDNTGEIDNFQYNTTFQNFLASGAFRTDLQNDFHSKLPIQLSTKVAFDYRKNLYKEFDNYGYSLPLLPPYNVSSTKSQQVLNDYTEPFITYGYLLDQIISYGDYAGLEGGFRSDWSSAFGRGATPFTFPHINGYFALSSFDFWKNSNVLSSLDYFKLRAAYGEAGIQPTPFQRYPVLNQGDFGTTLTYSTPTVINNPDLKVEVTKETELGVDYGINAGHGNWFSGVNGAISYWKRNSSNVIFNVSTALSVGAPLQTTNAITMASNGFEFSLNLPFYKSKNFNWNLTTNFGHQTSKIVSIAGGNDIILTSSAGSTSLVLSPGVKIGQIYGHKTITNVNQVDPTGNLYIAKGTGGQYVSVNGALVDTATKQIQFTPDKFNLGDPNPKFNMSFINSVNYKFVTLAFQIDWIYGAHLYNQTKQWMYRDGISGDFTKQVNINGQKGAWLAYWSSPYYGILGSTHGGDNDGTRDYFYENSSFVRLRNVSLAFELGKIIDLKYFKKAQLVFSGRNLFTITKYTGMDPEVSSGTVNSAFDRGVDHSTIPNVKSYQVGLNIGL